MRLIPVLCVMAVSLSVGLGCASSQGRKPLSSEEKAGLLLEAANGAVQEGDIPGALQLIDASEKESGGPTAESWLVKGLAMASRHESRLAVKHLRESLKLRPDFAPAQNVLGKLLLDQANYAEAETYLKRAASDLRFRDGYKARTSLGILYYRRGEYSKSRQELDRAILDEPQQACIAYYYRGHIELKDGQMESAIRDYGQASRKYCTGMADAHFALGIALERAKRFTDAKKKFLEIRQTFPETQVASQALERLKTLP